MIPKNIKLGGGSPHTTSYNSYKNPKPSWRAVLHSPQEQAEVQTWADNYLTHVKVQTGTDQEHGQITSQRSQESLA